MSQITKICDLLELTRLKSVCKFLNNYINTNPELFWFKHSIKLYKISYCRGCIIENEILPNYFIKDLDINYERDPFGLEIFSERIKMFSKFESLCIPYKSKMADQQDLLSKLFDNLDTRNLEDLKMEYAIISEKRKPKIDLMVLVLEGMVMYFAKDIIWFDYRENKDEKCGVCNIKLIPGDRCIISDCEHNFHIDCINRYCIRVENKCPICKTEIKNKLAKFDNFDENILAKMCEIF